MLGSFFPSCNLRYRTPDRLRLLHEPSGTKGTPMDKTNDQDLTPITEFDGAALEFD